MPRLRVHNFSVSSDGFGAGPRQTIDDPLGVGGEGLHHWAFATPTFGADGPGGLDEEFAARMKQGIGATLMGRNMFGPIRGDWPDDNWKGWWGDDPPYHHRTFVLTHHERASIPMQGGTTFVFVADGIHAALDQAFAAADGQDVLVGGGVSTVKQLLAEKLIDEMHLAFVPIELGSGERLVMPDEPIDGYSCVKTPSDSVVHAVYTRD